LSSVEQEVCGFAML